MNLTGANSLMEMPVGRFDGHAHVFRADLPMADGRRYTPDYDALPEEYCALLARFGLDGGLLVQPSFLGADNSYLLEVLDRYRGQDGVTLRGVAVLDPAVDVDLGVLREMGARGICGVRLNLVRRSEGFCYDDWAAVLAAVEKLGWHVELHLEGEHMPRILPDLTARHGKVVIDHFGLVPPERDCAGLACILAQPVERLWVKISGAYRVLRGEDRGSDVAAMAPLLLRYLDHFGPDRLVWGSDWPFTQFERQMSYAAALALAG